MSSIITHIFSGNILSTCVITSKVLFFQPPKYALRNSSSHLFQSLLSRSYTSSTLNESEKCETVFLNPKKKVPVQDEQAKLYKINWKERVGKLLLDGGILGSLLFLIGDGIFVWWVYRTNEQHINEIMEKGTRPQSIGTDDEYVSRHKDIERLKIIFQPNKNHAYYHTVYGEPGTGKTTLLKIAANEVG